MLQAADDELKKEGVRVIGISTDPVSKQLGFCKRYRLTFDLLSDPEAKIIKAFGVPLNKDGRAARETFMFRNGRMIWHDESVYPAHQAKVVRRVIKKVKEEKEELSVSGY